MPDISGFSEFVIQTEVEHSMHIIQELLEVLVGENHLEMELIEIEGDALFFITHTRHSFVDIEAQIADMVKAFHRQLAVYEHLRICNCGACMATIHLKLKFILHVGTLKFIEVHGRRKPFGFDVNRVHRLLKNEVPLHQYLLLSRKAWDHFTEIDRSSFTEINGQLEPEEVSYYYRPISTPPVERPPASGQGDSFIDHTQRSPDLKLEVTIGAPQEELFEYISNLQKRGSWDTVPRKLEFEQDRVNRQGTEHNCIVGANTLRFKTGKSKNSEGTEQIYTEYTEDFPLLRKYQYYVLLESLAPQKTLVQVLIFFESDLIGKIAWSMVLRRKIQRNWEQKLKQLAMLVH